MARARHDASNHAVLFLLVSLLCSSMATMALDIVLGKQIFDITHRELDLGFLGLAVFAPSAVLVLVTGSIADRVERRRVAAAGELGQALATAGILVYIATDPTAVGPLFALAVAFGTARAFSAPATRALPADIVPPDRVPWVVARYAATWQIASIVGPIAGGFLYAVDDRLPYAFVAAVLVIGAIAVLSVQPHPRASGSPADVVLVGPAEPELDHGAAAAPPARLTEALEGLRFIRRQPVLLGAISLDLFAVLFGGAVALLPAIADERLHVGAVGLGWLRAAGGIGAAVVTLRLAVRPLEHKVGITLLLCVGTFGAATIVLGATRNYAVAFVAMLVAFGADAISVFVRGTLGPLITPPDKRGRVLAVENVFIGASNELGAFESGVAGQLLGPAGAVVLGGVATVAVASGWSALFPELRNIDEFPRAVEEYVP